MQRAISPRAALAVLWSLLLSICLAPALASAQETPNIVIANPNSKPWNIAVTPFVGSDSRDSQVGRDIAGVVANDLASSGLFAPIDPRAFIQDAESLQTQPRFAEWNAINADFLVSGTVQSQSDGRLKVEFRLWDVKKGEQATGLAYFTVPANWRRVAHIVADAIYKQVTGEDGYFDTRIVYISESGPSNARVKRLAIMDQDGENHRFLTDGNTLVLTPRFSPTAQEITFLAYYNNRPRVYLFNIDTGRQEVLGDFPGMTFAPRFSPDGNQVIMSLAQDGNTDIWTMDLRNRHKAQLTNDPSIETSPSFAPDGSRIAFESDRSGTQQIYVMNASGGGATRITFGEGRYGSPVWSPRGDYIAFTKMNGGQFSIGVIRPDGTGERTLETAYHMEGPTWAPNGRVLMYFTQSGGRAQMRAVDVTGQHSRAVRTPQDASDPAWSPLIP